jgi:biopolymer transport protein ExbB
MGSYTAYAGWQSRLSKDGEVVAKNRADHRKLAPWLFLFITLGYTGGILSLVMQRQPILESPHFLTGTLVLALLGLNSLLSLIGFAPVALAAQSTPKPTSLWQVIESGGVMMYPLAALSVLALSLIFVFVFTLRRGSVVTGRYMQAADALLRKKDHLSLLAVSNRHRDAVASVMEKSLYFLTNNPGATITEVREVAMAEGVRLAGLWNQRVSYLADIGSIAPMVGLFGTVLGMIKSFTAVSGEMATSRSLLLSSGVAEALIATAAGLVIGIPAMAAFAFFRGRVQTMVSELEASSTVLMAQLSIGMPSRNIRD